MIPWKHVTGLRLRIINYTYLHKWHDIPDWRLNIEIGRLSQNAKFFDRWVARFPQGFIYEVEEDVKSHNAKEYDAENSS